ncbi:hypothetical protein [Blastopirellula marina]|uniref:Uncharacterized protein n=1 Tax=Blastopirellula marina DSM 3645 TaxID=314230 RepID=A3ZWY3_9BACT|nr:hypothetical protein [Blastopirellula marina]EAQ78963.1 hypothetical protein DSM3645_27823 [Blastopirellula marina DSM 3645]
METTIKFRCPNCHKSISAKEHVAGSIRTCPACAANIQVPALGTSKADLMTGNGQQVASLKDVSPQLSGERAAPNDDLIPLEIRMPGNMGGVKAKVDRETNKTLLTVIVGGLMTIFGFIVAAKFGGKVRLK